MNLCTRMFCFFVAATFFSTNANAEPNAGARPVGQSVGIGLGTTVNNDIATPDRASARFRLPGGIAIEPIVSMQATRNRVDGVGVDDKTTGYNLELAAVARIPLAQRDALDFLILAGAGFARSEINPPGDNNEATSNQFFMTWGLALDYWISPHWALSAQASNPLLGYASNTQASDFGDTTTSNLVGGLVFSPTYWVMGHLFF